MIDRLVRSAPATWDTILHEHRSLLGEELVTRIMGKCLEAASRSEFDSARAYAVLADHVEYVAGGRKSYQGRLQLHLGRLLAAHYNEQLALQIADTLIKTRPEIHAGHLLRGIVLLRLKDTQRAVESLGKAAAIEPDRVEIRMHLGAAWFAARDYQKARAEFEEVLKADPQNREAQNFLAYLAHEEKAYISQDPAALEHFSRGEELFKAGRFKEAIVAYQTAARFDPKFARPYLYIGDAYCSLGDVDRSVAAYKKAIEIDPSDGQSYRYLGGLYEQVYDKMQDVHYLDLAIESYSTAIRVDESYAAVVSADLERAQEKRARAKPIVAPKPRKRSR